MSTVTKFAGAAVALSMLLGVASFASASAKPASTVAVPKGATVTAKAAASGTSVAVTPVVQASVTPTVLADAPVAPPVVPAPVIAPTVVAGAAVANSASASFVSAGDAVVVNGPSIPTTPAALGDSPAMKINADGSISVDGAQIINIAGDTITATVTWGQINETWTVNVGNSTVLKRRYGATATMNEISVGDVISFTGTLLDMDGNNLITDANFLKDWSIQHKDSSFQGTVESLSTGNDSFDMMTSQGFMLDVFTTASTNIKINDATSTYSGIQVGDTVTNTGGVWDSDLNTLEANRVTLTTN